MSLGNGRSVGPNELRCVARQSLDLYRTLIIGGIYTVDKPQSVDIEASIRKAIKHCVAKHPILSAVIEDEETQHPRFVKPKTLSIKNHLTITGRDRQTVSDKASLESTLEEFHDVILHERETVPPWRVLVFPADRAADPTVSSSRSRYLILFGYYHSHGDGMAGVTFAKTLIEGLNLAERAETPFNADNVFSPSTLPFLPPLEKAAKLTISWSFLLAPILGEYLPSFIANALGLRPSIVPLEKNHWTGVIVGDPKLIKTQVKLLSICNAKVQTLLQACRRRECRLTGLLHQVVVRALSELLPKDTPAVCFTTQSAVDMRRVIPALSDDDMALGVTGYYETFARATADYWAGWTTGDGSHPVWQAVKKTTDGLAETANRLNDQPIGLLRYLSDMRRWTLGRLGRERECSYELSNLRAFDAPTSSEDVWHLESMVFSQPANLTGACFDVNVVTKKGGDMTIVLSWQFGALGVDKEKVFMAKVCELVETYIDELEGN